LRKQNNLAIRALNCVVVAVLIGCVDLPESSYFSVVRVPSSENSKGRLPVHFPLERDLGSGKKAYRDGRFSEPRVVVATNLVVTNLSPAVAGRDATLCRL
jgi:hypothetical protein